MATPTLVQSITASQSITSFPDTSTVTLTNPTTGGHTMVWFVFSDLSASQAMTIKAISSLGNIGNVYVQPDITYTKLVTNLPFASSLGNNTRVDFGTSVAIQGQANDGITITTPDDHTGNNRHRTIIVQEWSNFIPVGNDTFAPIITPTALSSYSSDLTGTSTTISTGAYNSNQGSHLLFSVMGNDQDQASTASGSWSAPVEADSNFNSNPITNKFGVSYEYLSNGTPAGTTFTTSSPANNFGALIDIAFIPFAQTAQSRTKTTGGSPMTQAFSSITNANSTLLCLAVQNSGAAATASGTWTQVADYAFGSNSYHMTLFSAPGDGTTASITVTAAGSSNLCIYMIEVQDVLSPTVVDNGVFTGQSTGAFATTTVSVNYLSTSGYFVVLSGASSAAVDTPSTDTNNSVITGTLTGGSLDFNLSQSSRIMLIQMMQMNYARDAVIVNTNGGHQFNFLSTSASGTTKDTGIMVLMLEKALPTNQDTGILPAAGAGY